MRKIALIIAIAAVFSGCGSSPDETPNANVNAPNAGITAGQNSNLVPYSNQIDPNAFNGNANNLRTVNRPPENTQESFKSRNAPDDSEFKTMMNSKGEVLETRTFRSHPQLLKIERVTIGSEQKLKVYLKNGRVYDTTEEKIPNFTVAAPQNILIAVGAAPKPGAQPEVKDKTKEEGANKN